MHVHSQWISKNIIATSRFANDGVQEEEEEDTKIAF